MLDVAITGGTIIDGSGNAASTGDIAIAGDRIVEWARSQGPAPGDDRRQRPLVTPGWVDVHTHYDGQATWDGLLEPSACDGVTTVVIGNCGVGFAPVRPHPTTTRSSISWRASRTSLVPP